MDIKSIEREITDIENEMSVLMKTYSELEEKLSLLNKVKFHLEKDMLNKTKSKEIPKDTRIEIFKSLFKGREDVYALRYESQKTGKSGYQPCCKNEWKREVCEKPRIKCSECLVRDLVPFTEQTIEKHLLGEIIAGIYPLLENEKCYFIAADFDKEGWQKDVQAFKTTCGNLKIPCYVERSRSGNGGHIWIFFSEEVSAKKARNLGMYIITETMKTRPEIGFDSYDRFFPNQDTMPQGGFGNLIALPLQRRARNEGNTLFLDENFKPYENQWTFLSNIKKVNNEEMDSILDKAYNEGGVIQIKDVLADEDFIKPWEVPPSGKIKYDFTHEELPEEIIIILANQIYIEHESLSPKLKNNIIRIAAFQNPEFYRAQAMRLPTYDKPRIINCGEIIGKYIILPVGCLDELLAQIKELGIKTTVENKRIKGNPIDVEFYGELFGEQEKVVKQLLKHDTGVLSATTAFGKTVIATYLIAKRKVNTLVLVHRKQLLEQWVERISTFLEIDKKEIGVLGGGKRKLTNKIDVALIQSLGQKGEIDDIIANYGYVIVDECHHISAKSFETILRQAKAKYLTGLSATVVRKDGHHPIIFMNLGPVRYIVDARKQAELRSFDHKVVVKSLSTKISQQEDNKPISITHIYAELAYSYDRSKIICEDIIKAVKEKRFPIVLTERKSHIDILENILRQHIENIFVLTGSTKNKERQEIIKKLEAIEDDAEKVLITTGKYLGEGFDNKRLDTLFLTLPISWKGTLSQYAGRLHREYAKKKEVVVYDYVDRNIPVLERMHQKRLKGYKAIGYNITE